MDVQKSQEHDFLKSLTLPERAVAMGYSGPSQGRKSLEGMLSWRAGLDHIHLWISYHLSWCFACNGNLICPLIEYIPKMFCYQTEFQRMAALYSIPSSFVPCHLHSSYYRYKTIPKPLDPDIEQCYNPRGIRYGHVIPQMEDGNNTGQRPSEKGLRQGCITYITNILCKTGWVNSSPSHRKKKKKE